MSGRATAPGGSDSGPDRPGDPATVARLICLSLLERAPRTRAQLAAALRKRRVPADAAAAVLDRFAEVGLVDDAAFAAAWVDSRHASRQLGRRALGAELRRRGVDDVSVREALDRLGPEQEEATARALVRRELPRLGNRDRSARIRRLTGLLQRRGYPPGMAYRLVAEALQLADAEVADGLPDEG
jgi:regulatory protein